MFRKQRGASRFGGFGFRREAFEGRLVTGEDLRPFREIPPLFNAR